MGKLSRLARARADYLGFLLAHEWPVVLSGVGVLLGAVTILPSAVGIVLSVIALGLGSVTFVRDFRLLRRRWSAYDFSLIAAPFPVADIPPPTAYPNAAYLHIPNRGTALVSDEIDQDLAARALPVEVDEQPYRLPRQLKASAPYVLPVRNRGRLVFNGQVVGMRGDPLPRARGAGSPVTLHRARFFDAQCSNEMCSLRITHRETGEEFDPRRRLLTDAGGRLRTLAESELADVVGISTVAVTTDGVLVLVRQSDRNIASALLLAPSGSGSLEPRDLGDAVTDAGGALQDVLRVGMERELCEETGLRADEIADTRVVGFARWMERGAKPEFFALTRLTVAAADLAGRRLASDERLYSSGLLTVPVDLRALGRELGAGVDLLAASSLPPQLREDGSLPLLVALRAAARWLVRQPENAPDNVADTAGETDAEEPDIRGGETRTLPSP
ncbi:hypothetical protein [Streptoalloteichus hindustanus]|uniref:hypothetical protein n=1 Tax=Streptoalloteichus hindustanus TaxID=2017 RepID=UPI001F1ED909|nr:hypothetical protein [Streptoalloteichus hindustanus]